MRKDEFVMRGQTESYNPSTGKGGVETLNFSGFKPGYAYRLIEFQLFPSTSIGTNSSELCATITAGKTALDPTNPDFSNDSLIATYVVDHNSGSNYGPEYLAVINENGLWIKDKLDDQIMIMHAENIQNDLLKNIVITVYDPNFENQINIIAKETIIRNKIWEIKNAIVVDNLGKKENIPILKFETNL